MKVGDLVQLSAYAKKLKQFYVNRGDDVGIIYESCWDLYSVRWASDNKKNINMDRRDLIHAKIKK